MLSHVGLALANASAYSFLSSLIRSMYVSWLTLFSFLCFSHWLAVERSLSLDTYHILAAVGSELSKYSKDSSSMMHRNGGGTVPFFQSGKCV